MSSKTIAILGGTGRMGVPLAANWANSGFTVMITSRDKSKAQAIVDKLKLGQGLKLAADAGGEITVPPLRSPAAAKDWRLSAGTVMDAATADVIVLGVMFDNQWAQLDQLKDAIKGQGKIIIVASCVQKPVAPRAAPGQCQTAQRPDTHMTRPTRM